MVREKSRKELETRGGRPFGKICMRLLFCVCVCCVRPGICMQRCKSASGAEEEEEELSLKLPLWRWGPWESRRDNGCSLISLFGLLV